MKLIIIFGVSFLFSIMFYNISFASPDLLDDSPPLIKIIDPVSGSTMPHDIVIVNGTSYDHESGIKKIEVLVHQYPFNDEFEFKLANPVSYNNWSKWSIPIPIQIPGIYRILAHAEDNAGNENWVESTINVPFLTNKTNSTDFNENNNSQTYGARIAFVNSVFTEAAYGPNAFYDFYAKYKSVPWGRIVTTDLNMLTASVEKSAEVDPHSSYDVARNLSEFSHIALDNNHIILLNEVLKKELPTTLLTVIRNEDVHNGYIFDQQHKNAYDVLVLSHEEYVTDSMYNNYKKFVSEGGTIIFLDSNMFYAEVEYDKINGTITLIKGHDWEYDGRSAKKSVGERWFYENREWVGSNFLVSDLKEKIYFKNNPFNYTHFEENYVSNPNARIILDYEIETPNSRPHMENVTVATYDLKFGNGKVIVIGLYGQNLINNTAFLKFFELLLFDSVDKTNPTNFEDKVKDIFSTDYHMNSQNNITRDVDKFGIAKVYPTKQGGREWYVDMDDPLSDGIFSTKSNLSKQPDGSWQANDESKGQVRLVVNTPANADEWKNVEITGYARATQTTGHESYETSDLANMFQWYARGGVHNDNFPCEGTSMKGRLYLNGDSSWIKEIWHAGGYTEEKGRDHVTNPLVWKNDSAGRYYDGKWFGFKVIIFNVNNDSAVKMESYLDDDVTNTWRKISSLIDVGEWDSNDPEFYDVDCNRPKNYIVTNSGPIAGFRTDDIIWNFKYLSIREISAG